MWSVADNKKNHYVDNGWPEQVKRRPLLEGA